MRIHPAILIGTGVSAGAIAAQAIFHSIENAKVATPNPPTPWTAQSLVGHSVELSMGTNANGTPIADPGTYRIEQLAGNPEGYATLDEANAEARRTVSTKVPGTTFLRWMVVEHDDRFYGAVAQQLPQGTQAKPLTPQFGNVVAWSALNHVTDDGVDGWQVYSWSETRGAQSMHVPYGTSNVFADAIADTKTEPRVADEASLPRIDPADAVRLVTLDTMVDRYMLAYDHSRDGVLDIRRGQTFGTDERVTGNVGEIHTMVEFFRSADANSDQSVTRDELHVALSKFDTTGTTGFNPRAPEMGDGHLDASELNTFQDAAILAHSDPVSEWSELGVEQLITTRDGRRGVANGAFLDSLPEYRARN